MSEKPKGKSNRSVETVDQYLARGGSIKRLPIVILDTPPESVRKNGPTGPAVFLTLDEADLFFGEPSKKKPKKNKPTLKIDLDVLPVALRAKFIAKLKEEADGEGYEDEIEEIEEDDEEESGD